MRLVRSQTKPGFSIIEAVIACAVVAILITAFTGGFTLFNRTQNQAVSRYRAALVAEEGLEATRSIRDNQYNLLVDGTHGLAQVSGVWTFSGASDTTNGIMRTVTISSIDAVTKNILSTVSWAAGGRTQTYNVATRLTNWRLPTQQPTATTLAAAPNPSTYGETVTLTATIAPLAATGTVTFKDGVTTIGTSAITSGVATITTSLLEVGSQNLTAVYSGDATHLTNTSTVFIQVVQQISTVTALVSDTNPSTYGATVTLTANVTPGAASGTVTFKDGAATIGSEAVVGGIATMTISSLTAGSHSLTAEYSGAVNYMSSVSAPVTQTVNQNAAAVVLVSNPNPSTPNQTVTLTATINPSSATGTVTFKDGAATIGSGVVTAGVATMTIGSLASSTHSLTAVYSGDSNHSSAASAPVSQVVEKNNTTSTLTSDTNPANVSQTITLTTTISPNAATGTVTFKDGVATIGTGAITGGVATMTTSALAVGSHSLTAVYGGDTAYLTSASPAINQVIQKITTTTVLASNINPSTPGQTITLTATVAPAAVVGTITFKDGATTIGTGTLSGGVATMTTSALAADSHSLTAVYGGNATYATSTSSVLTQRVKTWGNPVQEATLNLTGTLAGVKVQTVGNYAYVVRASGSSSFVVVDISNPVTPVPVSMLTIIGAPQNLHVVGDYAYVVSDSDTSELQIINISNPSTPYLVRSFDLAGNNDANTIQVIGTTAYIGRTKGANVDEFVTVNVSNPAAPTVIGSTKAVDTVNDLVVIGSYAYLATSSNPKEIEVMSVINPAAPTSVGFLNLSGNTDATTVTGYGTTIFVGQGSNLQSIDISTPASPQLLDFFPVSGQINDISLNVDGTLAFLATSYASAEFQVVDISFPGGIGLYGSLNLSANLSGVAYNSIHDRAIGASASTAAEIAIFAPQ